MGFNGCTIRLQVPEIYRIVALAELEAWDAADPGLSA